MNFNVELCITALLDYRQWFSGDEIEESENQEILYEIDDTLDDLGRIRRQATTQKIPIWQFLGCYSEWNELVEFSRAEWRKEINSELTSLGYWQWVKEQIEMNLDKDVGLVHMGRI